MNIKTQSGMRNQKTLWTITFMVMATWCAYTGETCPQNEVADPATAVTPIVHQANWIGERDLPGYDYAPAYEPNVVSFDSANRPYMRMPLKRSANQNVLDIQRLDSSGNCGWETVNLTSALTALGWTGETDSGMSGLRFTRDQRVVFSDNDHAFTFLASALWTGLHAPVLAYSKDKTNTWEAFKLDSGDWSFGRVQPRSFHGDMQRPPLIMLSQPSWASPTHNNLGLVAPIICNGQLQIPEPIILDTQGGHQGGGMGARFAVSSGDRSFIVWASLAFPAGVPTDQGTPTYIQEFDHIAGALVGTPVFLGLAGGPVEGADFTQIPYTPNLHNIPAIDIDSEGYLHVVLGAHHRNFKYTRSNQPLDINSGWTPLEILGGTRDLETDPVDPKDPNCERRCYYYTYASLIIDDQDNLHVFSRWAGTPNGEPGYFMQIAHQRKPAGQPWEPRVTLVRPFRWGYSHWYQKPAIDRMGRLFISYIYYGDCLSTQEVADYEAKYGESLTWESSCKEGTMGKYNVTAHEPVVLVSDDSGLNWRLATTVDFASGTAVSTKIKNPYRIP